MVAADFAAQVLGFSDVGLRDQVVRQNVHVTGDGYHVTTGEACTRQSRPAAFTDGNLTGENRLNAPDAAGDKNDRGVDAVLVKNLRVLGDPQHG